MAEANSIIALIVVYLIVLIGLLGSLLPVLPGCFIIWCGILIYKFWIPEDYTWTFVAINALLVILAQVLDFLAGLWGARKFGASWRGGIGALIGAILGPFVLSVIPGLGTVAGLILGPVIGAFLGELSAGRTIKEGGKAGVGTVVGGMVAFAMKFAIALGMVGWFTFQVFFAG
ncbi:MAG: DUF456 domain-containing protein [Verrucomicrobiota bacterium]